MILINIKGPRRDTEQQFVLQLLLSIISNIAIGFSIFPKISRVYQGLIHFDGHAHNTIPGRDGHLCN